MKIASVTLLALFASGVEVGRKVKPGMGQDHLLWSWDDMLKKSSGETKRFDGIIDNYHKAKDDFDEGQKSYDLLIPGQKLKVI